jgi:zinc transport system substrate-binding protein
MYRIFFILLFLCSFLQAKEHITVSYPVQKKFIEKIAKNEFVIHVIHGEFKDIKDMNKNELNELFYSKVYFTLGLEEEESYKKLFKIENTRIKFFNMTKGIKKDTVNGKVNPYVWMDPILVRDMATSLYDELSSLMSYKKKFFEKNYKKFLNQLDSMFLHMKKMLDSSQYYNLYVYDSYWYYYAKRFGLNLYYKPKRVMYANEVKAVIKESRKYNIRKLLVDENSSYTIAKSLASHINAKIIENSITKYNWRANIYTLTRKISGY